MGLRIPPWDRGEHSAAAPMQNSKRPQLINISPHFLRPAASLTLRRDPGDRAEGLSQHGHLAPAPVGDIGLDPRSNQLFSGPFLHIAHTSTQQPALNSICSKETAVSPSTLLGCTQPSPSSTACPGTNQPLFPKKPARTGRAQPASTNTDLSS